MRLTCMQHAVKGHRCTGRTNFRSMKILRNQDFGLRRTHVETKISMVDDQRIPFEVVWFYWNLLLERQVMELVNNRCSKICWIFETEKCQHSKIYDGSYVNTRGIFWHHGDTKVRPMENHQKLQTAQAGWRERRISRGHKIHSCHKLKLKRATRNHEVHIHCPPRNCWRCLCRKASTIGKKRRSGRWAAADSN